MAVVVVVVAICSGSGCDVVYCSGYIILLW